MIDFPETLAEGAAATDLKSLGDDGADLTPWGPPTDGALWDKLVADYTPMLWCCMAEYDVPEAERDDCIQEVWLSAVARLHDQFASVAPHNLAPWLWSIARNKAIDVIRRASRRLTEPLYDLDVPTSHAGPRDSLSRKEDLAALHHALARLKSLIPVASYQALILCDLEGRDSAEAAALLGLTTGNVRVRLHRARAALRELLVGGASHDGERANGRRPRLKIRRESV